MSLRTILTTFEDVQTRSEKNGVVVASTARGRFAAVVDQLVHQYNLPLSLVYATDDREKNKTFGVHAILASDGTHEWLILSTELPQDDPQYPSLTRTVMAAHWYERYAMDMFGIVAQGHPDPRRLVHHENVPAGTHPLRKDFAWNTKLPHADEPYPMHHVEGEGIFEIPVGPIHAGIIEPGHFRFNVAGERIITLEGKLFFTHKGIEKLVEGKTVDQALPFVERLSADAAASHALAFVQAVEYVGEVDVPKRAQALRAVVCELERIAMHIHDLSNIAGMGTGYTFMAAQGFRIKERFIRLSERLFGNRFWRGYIVPGGCAQDFSVQQIEDIRTTVASVLGEMHEILSIGLASDGLRERLETTGILPTDAAAAFGALGVAARASGIDRDVRRDHPYGAYASLRIPVATRQEGDVYARYMVRVEELATSASLVTQLLHSLPSGNVRVSVASFDGFGLGAVESWRGEILTAVHLRNGIIERCALRDPSFCNWALFGSIGPGNIVPDFPLCNKSLNLSYSGTDL